MKKHLNRIAQYSAIILISAIPFPFDAFADDIDKKQTAAFVTPADKASASTKRKLLQERVRQIPDEAAGALAGTQDALVALGKNDAHKALALLQMVCGKLDVLQAQKPALPFVPADVEAEILDFNGDAEEIEKALNLADDLLDDGKPQDARRLLDGLVSEVRVSTISIPLGAFQAAVKDAILLIHTGKMDSAAVVLDETLNMLVTTTEVMPLPVLSAETLLTEASELEHKNDLSKAQSRQEVLMFAEAAKAKLQKAVLLGYGNKDDYKMLYTAIDEIKETIHSKDSDATWKKIKDELSGLKNKIVNSR